MTGLKPNHFYNIRVIAVGYNNFQAGSRVIRLRTYARDGRPQLGDSRLPSNFVPEEQQLALPSNHGDEDGGSRSSAAGVETATIPESSGVSAREVSITGPRRNTLTRKHSPSTTSMDQSVKDALSKDSEESLQELGEKFESIRREIDDMQAQISRDEKEHKELMAELAEEKKTKRRIQKEKDDTTEKLKREMGSTERAMRSAQQRKTQKEKLLREKQAERQKLRDDMAKWEKDMASMLKRQNGFEKDKNSCQKSADARAEELRSEIALAQASLAQEEMELKEKSKELKDAEEQRKKLPGGEESEEWREMDRQIKRDWDIRARDLQRRLFSANRKLRMVSDYETVLQAQLATTQQSGLFMYNQANSSGVDFDVGAQNQLKRRSRNSNSLSNVVIPSPVQSYSIADRSYGPSVAFGPPRPPTIPPGFVPGPFMEHNPDFASLLEDDGMRHPSVGAPLSPTATSLLPAGMLDDLLDDEPPSPGSRRARHNTFGSAFSPENDPQSPASSARSISIFSSPQNSSQHLPFSQYTGENSERRSLKGLRGDLASSPIAPQNQGTSRRSFLPWLHRAPKAVDEPPALGSLKSSQSQSLPRQAEDGDLGSNKRRISFSSNWNVFNRNSAGPEILDAGSPNARGLPSRRLGLVTNANSMGSNMFSERDPSSPRPVSIASSELPRPSTESGSIWARAPPPPGRIWSADENPWAPSRNPSRRPSIHGSPSALKTTLADADDEILDDSELLHASPSQVGVIGTKPSSKTLSQRLNPAAPSFMAGLFRTKLEKEADREQRDIRDKSRNKGKDKEKKPRVSLSSVSETAAPSTEESPLEHRKSRDIYSIGTPSLTESRESLALDQSVSNTPSDQATPGIGSKEQESGLRKLLRKGSSSKFSFTSVRGLGGKKGPGSVTNSDKNASVERSSFDEYAEDSNGGGGGLALGRSYESLHSSPSLGPTSAARSAKDKSVSWGSRFAIKKKVGKEKESLDLEREESTASTATFEEK